MNGSITNLVLNSRTKIITYLANNFVSGTTFIVIALNPDILSYKDHLLQQMNDTMPLLRNFSLKPFQILAF